MRWRVIALELEHALILIGRPLPRAGWDVLKWLYLTRAPLRCGCLHGPKFSVRIRARSQSVLIRSIIEPEILREFPFLNPAGVNDLESREDPFDVILFPGGQIQAVDVLELF
jgi:hypothetical protein